MCKFFDNTFSSGLCFFILIFFSVNLLAKEYLLSEGLTYSPALEFSRHSMPVKPLVYTAKDNRRIRTTTTSKKDGSHEDELIVTLEVDGIKYIMDLRLNRNLIPINHSVLYQKEGKMVALTANQELCHYVGEVRNIKNSRVALSTCNGLDGIIFDGNSTKFIEAGEERDLESEHLLHYHEHLTAKMPPDEPNVDNYLDSGEEQYKNYENTFDEDMETKFSRILRYRRSKSEKTTRDPYRSNEKSRYIEMLMVVDHALYSQWGLNGTHQRCKDIANIVNMLYTPLNIFVILVYVEIWTEGDEIRLSDNMAATRIQFNDYLRIKRRHKDYDFSQLITKQNFSGGVIGEAIVGGLCSLNFSGAVAFDDASDVSSVAVTIAHELGHSIGILHDSEECYCPYESCIMFRQLIGLPVHWSLCSYKYLISAFQKGTDYCLRNKPILLFEPNCGNGIVETGEQCDCGHGWAKSMSLDACDSCCETDSCMLRDNATCASGQCCDLKTCQPLHAGTPCRPADHECDLPEYCTGKSEFCPDNIFKIDTEPCNHGKDFCYQGTCPSRSEQCRMLWGPSGTSGPEHCYKINMNGSEYGNCGYDSSRRSYVSCAAADVYCGRVQCDQPHDVIEFGILVEQCTCRPFELRMTGDNIDPGLVHDGAVCGDSKICVKQKCLTVDSVRVVPRISGPDCTGRGVRNSLGHCHCDVGFSPPDCEEVGPGGSEDSGPASRDNRVVLILSYVMFALITLTITLLLILRIRNRRLQKVQISTEYLNVAANAMDSEYT